jgi:hypothetical protein
METRVFGDLQRNGLEVVSRQGRYFVRYDAGAHQVAWREDVITQDEFASLSSSSENERSVILALQERLSGAGIDPYKPNWLPPTGA